MQMTLSFIDLNESPVRLTFLYSRLQLMTQLVLTDWGGGIGGAGRGGTTLLPKENIYMETWVIFTSLWTSAGRGVESNSFL